MHLVRMAVIAVAALLTTACIQAPKKQAFNREAAVHIKTITVVRAENQAEYEAVMTSHPGASFGLIGGLVIAADRAAKAKRLTAALDPKETALQERFGKELNDKLTAAGYQVGMTQVPSGTKLQPMLEATKSTPPADAVLAVEIIGLYAAAGPTSDYLPTVEAKVCAKDVKSGQVLYEDTITYGLATASQQTLHLVSKPEFRFADISALEADSVKARAGLYEGLSAIAGQIAADLKKN